MVRTETEKRGKCRENKVTEDHAREKTLRETLVECSWVASRLHGCFYGRFSYTQTVVRRKCKLKGQVAIARKMLAAIWHILHDNIPCRDYNPDTEVA